MKVYFVLVLLLASGIAHAGTIDAEGVLRNDDGSIRYVPFEEVRGRSHDGSGAGPDICEREFPGWNLYLPTIRDLAMIAQAAGAKGVLEWPRNTLHWSYRLVKAINRGRGFEKFYFSSQGYVRPAGDVGDNKFWSSSTYASWIPGSYVLNGRTGGIEHGVAEYVKVAAVRCVRAR